MGMTIQRMGELLEIERECVLRNASGECNRFCAECDLLQDDTELHEMYTDVLDLLKAHEPRVMTLEEVRALQDGALVWAEDNDKADVIPVIVNHVWNSLPNMVSFTAAHMREVKADMLWYGVKWRCWTSRPDQATREATPWG